MTYIKKRKIKLNFKIKVGFKIFIKTLKDYNKSFSNQNSLVIDENLPSLYDVTVFEYCFLYINIIKAS